MLFASSKERSATSFLVTETYRLIPQFCTSRVTSTAIGAPEGFRALPAQMMKSELISPYSGQARETKKITNTVFWGSNGLPEIFGRPFVIGIISLVREKSNAAIKQEWDAYDERNPEIRHTRPEPLFSFMLKRSNVREMGEINLVKIKS